MKKNIFNCNLKQMRIFLETEGYDIVKSPKSRHKKSVTEEAADNCKLVQEEDVKYGKVIVAFFSFRFSIFFFRSPGLCTGYTLKQPDASYSFSLYSFS